MQRSSFASALASALTLSVALSLAGCDDGSTEQGPATAAGPNDAHVAISIAGSGSVKYAPQPAVDCVGDGANATAVPCTPVTFHDGSGSVTASPAAGWRFDSWSLTLGDQSKQQNAITNPSSPTQQVLAGVHVALTAIFVKLPTNVRPALIQATFVDQLQSTTYDLVIQNPDREAVDVTWSGPNCGEFTPKETVRTTETRALVSMTWNHPHPACDANPAHATVEIVATVKVGAHTFACTYKGAETGEGPVCTER
jgi:hypothetical protein